MDCDRSCAMMKSTLVLPNITGLGLSHRQHLSMQHRMGSKSDGGYAHSWIKHFVASTVEQCYHVINLRPKAAFH